LNDHNSQTSNGLLLVDKPFGITSFDVIRQLRRITGQKKIGHAGTLDPLATGLMLLLFGTACKRAQDFSKLNKRYIARVHFGFESTTGDEEGIKTSVSNTVPDVNDIKSALEQFLGDIVQIPSVYSAIKIDGKEAYKRARDGEKITMPSRTVHVYGAEVLRYEYPILEVSFMVSSGTYIRTLVEDIGRHLKVGAYLSGLVRTEVGPYDLADATCLDDIDVTKMQENIKPL
jgi:tRNA pseudouridine55 synthase